MKIDECYACLRTRWRDQLIVCSSGMASQEWHRQTASRTSFYLQASMGVSSMLSLGLALALPQACVWNLDGDGGLAMNPGALLTEAEAGPSNMVHFVLVNRVYGVIGCHPYPGSQVVDFVELARSSGITRTFCFTDARDLEQRIDDVLATPEYAFVVLEVEPESGRQHRVPLDGPELKYAFVRHVEERFGETVLNEGGY